MTLAAYASLTLTRFDKLRLAGSMQTTVASDVLYSAAGADSRATGSIPDLPPAFVFTLMGLHASLQSVQEFIAITQHVAAWMNDAAQKWSGLLKPFCHGGTVYYHLYHGLPAYFCCFIGLCTLTSISAYLHPNGSGPQMPGGI